MTAAHNRPGILAIWNDCAPGHEPTFEDWYQGEHLIERVSVPGFRRGRRFEALRGDRQYFTYYEVDAPDVLTSDAYVARLNDPTPLTREVMSGVFERPSRTVCREIARHGAIDGVFAVTAISHDLADAARWHSLIATLPNDPGIASARIWQAVDGASNVGAREQEIRGRDELIAACMMISTLREADTEAVRAWMIGNDVSSEAIGTYRMLCELQSDDV